MHPQDQKATEALGRRLEAWDHFLVDLDDTLRPLSDAEDITRTAAQALGQHMAVNRCAYAIVDDNEDTITLTGNYIDGVDSVVGPYAISQFAEDWLRHMRAGEPYLVSDSLADSRITEAEQPTYAATAIAAMICAPILKRGRFVAAMAVHSRVPREWGLEEVELVQRVASRCWESIERARVTQSLKDSEQQFRALANSIPNLAWMARPDGWIYWYNQQWYDYTGTTHAEMEGWRWESVHDPEVLPVVKQRWQASIAAGESFEMVFPLRGANGTFRRFLTRVNPLRNARGEVVHWFGTNTDVESERLATEVNATLRERERLAREEVELQKRLLHSLFMQAPTLIAVLRGPEHVVELANPPLCAVWGRTQEQLINRSLFDAMPELRDQVFRSLLDEVFRTGVPFFGQETPARFDRGGGTSDTVYFNFVYSPFRSIAGAIEGIFVIASDVTDQVLARHQVNDLRQAAEAANRAKDEFLAMLGHELRNPLSPILTALQLMKLRCGDTAEYERTVIERQVAHLTRLVDDLLDVSRIARGKVDLKRETVEIAQVAAKAIEMTSPLFEERMQALELNIPRQGLEVNADPVRLSQVISNLLANAAKYTPSGGRITVQAAEEAGDIVLRVRDTGMGIAPDILPHVFDLFVQGRQAIDRSQGGLGLGLTIVRNLVEAHGGRVSAHSGGLGHGSEFVVRLPRAAAAAVTSAAPDGLHQRVERPSQAARVLIVDDNVDGAQVLGEVMALSGYETRVAHDAPTALRIATEFQPTIAVLDLGLPVMDGYELAKLLRALPGLANVRLIAVTGYGQEADRARTRRAGFHQHLVKPVDFETVERAFTATADDGRASG